GEHELALAQDGPRPLDPPDAGVAVPEREGEGPAEGADRLVQRQVGVDLAAVGEHLGAAADARPQRADQDLTVGGLGDGYSPELDVAGRREGHARRLGGGIATIRSLGPHGHLSCTRWRSRTRATVGLSTGWPPCPCRRRWAC